MKRKDGGLSEQSAAFHLQTLKRFVWWLSMKRNLPVKPDVIDDVPGFDPKGNRVHARRDLTPAELERLLDAAKSSTRTMRGLDGPARHAMYLTAFGTGFRRSELGKLKPEGFRLDESPPVVTLSAKETKNGKPARQPIPAPVAAVLREYLKGRPKGEPAFPGPWAKRAANLIQADLEAAGIPSSVDGPNGPEFADLHALRHTYLSSLAASGATPKELQELARHGDPKLTLSVYTHARQDGLAAAVSRLAVPGGASNPLAALSRDDLEGAVVGLTAVVLSILGNDALPFAPAPALAPAAGIPGDAGVRPDTTPIRKHRSRKTK